MSELSKEDKYCRACGKELPTVRRVYFNTHTGEEKLEFITKDCLMRDEAHCRIGLHKEVSRWFMGGYKCKICGTITDPG